MRKVLLISPHFDDAILSVGQFMADRPDTEVVTIFGGFPSKPDDVHTDYDIKCGFANAHDAVAERQRENDAACGMLRATKIDLPFADEQYGMNTNVYTITEELQEILDANDYEFIMGPLGLGHPDHIKTTDALLMLRTDLPIYLWEDLPLRVIQPELVWTRLAMLDLASKNLIQHATTNYKIAAKMRALACYKSQIGTGILDPYVMYVPERIWQYK